MPISWSPVGSRCAGTAPQSAPAPGCPPEHTTYPVSKKLVQIRMQAGAPGSKFHLLVIYTMNENSCKWNVKTWGATKKALNAMMKVSECSHSKSMPFRLSSLGTAQVFRPDHTAAAWAPRHVPSLWNSPHSPGLYGWTHTQVCECVVNAIHQNHTF